MNRFTFVLLTSLLVLLLPACGHKGRLYLPDQAHKTYKDLTPKIPNKSQTSTLLKFGYVKQGLK